MLETCYETLLNSADKQGFVVYYGQKIPMQRFLRDIEGFAASLAALQLNKGDVVTVYLPTCPQSLAAFYACSKLGLVANFVHPL
ncbi:MAG: AMP-binding protein, partial [Candidatus Fimimonas sp.]